MRIAALLLALSLLHLTACKPADADTPGAAAGPAAGAAAEDEKRIAQCIADNKNEGAKREVVQKYCACMNRKMGNETLSISTWEDKNPDAMKACDKESGWK